MKTTVKNLTDHQGSEKAKDQTKIERGIIQNSSERIQEDETPEQKTKKFKRQRRDQSLFFYWGNLFSILLFSGINVFMFFVKDMNTMAIVGFIVVGVISMISIVGSCMLVETKKDMFYLYLLFDSILVACITAIAGVTGIVSVMVPPEAISYALLAFWNAILFVISGNNRVIIAYVKYKKWQVILFKISLCLSFLTFLVLAMYFMSNDFPNPLMSDQKQEAIRDLFFLYIFGLFTLYMEIFTRLSEKDGSADLQYHYRVDEEDIFVEASLSDDISEVSRLNQEGSGKNPKKVYTIQI